MISLDNGNYRIKSDQEKETIVSCDDLLLSGKSLYDAFFFDVEIGKPLDLTVLIDDKISGSREHYIANEIKRIIDGIVKKINDEVKETVAP